MRDTSLIGTNVHVHVPTPLCVYMYVCSIMKVRRISTTLPQMKSLRYCVCITLCTGLSSPCTYTQGTGLSARALYDYEASKY